MTRETWSSGLLCVGLLALLPVVRGSEAKAPEGGGAGLNFHAVLATLRNTGLNREDREKQTVGYYEGLLNRNSSTTSMGSLLTGQFGRSRAPRSRNIRALTQPDKYQVTRDFLYYVPKPHLDLPDYDDEQLRLVTNSDGLSDREYQLARSPRTKRIAVLGDSVTRGQGARFGQSFEALLEERLAESHRSADVDGFEILNFAVSGYRLTQTVDYALAKAARYQPDVYVLALSELGIGGRWSDHLEQLVADGIDPKYDFLRQVVRRAGLTGKEDSAALDAKLAPFRLEIVRWAIQTLRDHAAANGARLIVLLVPTVRDARALQEDFAGVAGLAVDLQVPVVDLLDTFADVSNLNEFRVSEDNVHPNTNGHRRLAERLYNKLMADPSSRAAILGAAAASPRTD